MGSKSDIMTYFWVSIQFRFIDVEKPGIDYYSTQIGERITETLTYVLLAKHVLQ
jgi:hypothetical protein